MNRKLTFILAGLEYCSGVCRKRLGLVWWFRRAQAKFASARCLSFWYRCCCTNGESNTAMCLLTIASALIAIAVRQPVCL